MRSSPDFGRTGRMFAVEYAGIEPDLMTVAKSIAGGVPLSALIGKAEIMDAPPPGGLGGTYAGSPLGCAAALAVLEVMKSEKLLERSLRLGEILQARLRALQKRFGGDRRDPWPRVNGGDGAGQEWQGRPARRGSDARPGVAAARHGLVILSCGIYGNVIRFLAPLTIPEPLLAEGLDKLEAALAEVTAAASQAAA